MKVVLNFQKHELGESMKRENDADRCSILLFVLVRCRGCHIRNSHAKNRVTRSETRLRNPIRLKPNCFTPALLRPISLLPYPKFYNY